MAGRVGALGLKGGGEEWRFSMPAAVEGTEQRLLLAVLNKGLVHIQVQDLV